MKSLQIHQLENNDREAPKKKRTILIIDGKIVRYKSAILSSIPKKCSAWEFTHTIEITRLNGEIINLVGDKAEVCVTRSNRSILSLFTKTRDDSA